MKKGLGIAMFAAIAAVSMGQATDVIDMKIKATTLNDKESIKAWMLDDLDLVVVQTKGAVIVGDADWDWVNIDEVTNDDGSKGKGIEDGWVNFDVDGVNDDVVNALMDDAVVFGKCSWNDARGLWKESLKGVGLGEVTDANADVWETSYQISTRYNTKMSELTEAELVAYIAKKLKLSAAQTLTLTDDLGFVL